MDARHPSRSQQPFPFRIWDFGFRSDLGFRAPDFFCLLFSVFCLLLSDSTAHAFPPGPYHLLYGTVRDQYGTPLTSPNGQVILQTPSGVRVSVPVVPRLSSGVNYLIKVPMDSGATPDPYLPYALVPAASFKLLVAVGTATNVPIEMTGTNLALGQWAKTSRLDLTLGVDSNGDGIPDAWEYAFLATLGLSLPLSSLNANSVLTPDGLTLWQQYMLGTYPFDPGNPLKIVFFGFNGAAPILQFPTVAGRSYTVLESADLRNWTPVAFHLTSDSPGGAARAFYLAPTTAAIQLYTALAPAGSTQQFYRILVQ